MERSGAGAGARRIIANSTASDRAAQAIADFGVEPSRSRRLYVFVTPEQALFDISRIWNRRHSDRALQRGATNMLTSQFALRILHEIPGVSASAKRGGHPPRRRTAAARAADKVILAAIDALLYSACLGAHGTVAARRRPFRGHRALWNAVQAGDHATGLKIHKPADL